MHLKFVPARISLGLAAIFLILGPATQAGNVNVTGNLTYVQGTGGVYDYTLTFSNSGPESVESLWLGWMIGLFDITSPTDAGNSLGWSSDVDGNSIQYGGTSGTALAAGGTATFTFDSTSTPANFQSGTAGPSVAYGVNATQFALVNTTADTFKFTPTITVVTNNPPVITTQPQSQTVLTNSTVLFSVTASNAMSYQWESNMVDITGATNSTLTLNNVTTNNSGTYTVIVSNATESVTSSNAVLLVLTILPPTITVQPQSTNAMTNSTVTFSVTASNAASFQWESNMVDISAATNSSLVLTNVQPADSASYQVVVSNASGSVTSTAAILIVGFPVTFSEEPSNITVSAGTPITLQAAATGQPEPQLQWFLNSNPIFGQTSSNLAIDAATAGTAGTYTLVASNVFGAQTSSPAVVTVTPLTSTIKEKLAVSVNPAGAGHVTPNLNGSSLDVAHNYTVTASPAKGQAFSHWSGIDQSENATLTFVMPLASNATLTANFVASPFGNNGVAGTYSGLFWDPSDLSVDAAGFFTATVSSSGMIAGQVKIAGATTPFSTLLAADGTTTLTLKGHGQSSLELALQVDLSGLQTLTGTVTDTNHSFDAQLTAYRAGFSASDKTTAFAGNYTWAMSGAASNAPGGYSYGTASVADTGAVHTGVFLADGSSSTFAGSISTNGVMPLYVSLSAGKESFLAWLTFTNSTTDLSTNSAFWLKSSGGKGLYATGFTLSNLSLLMGAYSAPAKGANALGASTVSLQLSGAGLMGTNTDSVTLNASGTGTDANQAALSVNGHTGLVSGTFKDPASGKTIHLNGAVLKQLPAGYGFFIDNNESGAVVVEPQ